ncbi:hypothetical protein B4100_0337 [Heyndrickxia coagulans]|nr:hypothetical protein B4100_0337 [Heyndrickxia coagulans]
MVYFKAKGKIKIKLKSKQVSYNMSLVIEEFKKSKSNSVLIRFTYKSVYTKCFCKKIMNQF